MSDFAITPENRQAIDAWVKKYPADQQRSAVVPALLLVQTQNGGWLSEAAMQAVAQHLQLPPVQVFEVATFYDMFELKPIGRHKISLCCNLSCTLRGADDIAAAFKARLGIELGDTTADGLFTLREVECLAACGGAPMCQVNDRDYHENLTVEKVNQLIDQLEAEASA